MNSEGSRKYLETSSLRNFKIDNVHLTLSTFNRLTPQGDLPSTEHRIDVLNRWIAKNWGLKLFGRTVSICGFCSSKALKAQKFTHPIVQGRRVFRIVCQETELRSTFFWLTWAYRLQTVGKLFRRLKIDYHQSLKVEVECLKEGKVGLESLKMDWYIYIKSGGLCRQKIRRWDLFVGTINSVGTGLERKITGIYKY